MLDTTLLLLDGFFPLNEIKSQHRTVNDRSCLNKRLLGTPKSKCEHETYQIISKCELKLDVRHYTEKFYRQKKNRVVNWMRHLEHGTARHARDV